MFLAALGNGLWMRYERYGEVAYINQAIEAGRESVARAAPAERANHLSDLSISPKARYESLGDPADLDEAVRAAEEGDASGWRSSSERPTCSLSSPEQASEAA